MEFVIMCAVGFFLFFVGLVFLNMFLTGLNCILNLLLGWLQRK
jgi:hypothetical protein